MRGEVRVRVRASARVRIRAGSGWVKARAGFRVRIGSGLAVLAGSNPPWAPRTPTLPLTLTEP